MIITKRAGIPKYRGRERRRQIGAKAPSLTDHFLFRSEI